MMVLFRPRSNAAGEPAPPRDTSEGLAGEA